jgi:hypothetical protein
MKKFKYLILLLLFFILFLPQAVSAASDVSEYWHNSICLQMYHSNVYLKDLSLIDINYAYIDTYDEEEGEEEWEDEWEEEIEVEPETLESQIERANKEARIIRNTTITGGIMGTLPTLIFAGIFAGSGDVQVYGILAGTAGGAVMGSLSGNAFARVMISMNNKNASVGFLTGVPLGMLFGALSGATAGGLMFIGAESDPNDWIEVGPRFGMFGGAIIGTIVGGITGGIAGSSINESLGARGEAVIVQKRSPSGRMTPVVRIPDSTGVKRTLVEVPKPPLSMSRIGAEVIVGTLSGYCLGGICELKFDKNDLAWGVAGVIGTTIGVYSAGNRNDETGNFVGTLFFSAIGMTSSYLLLTDSQNRENRSLFLWGSPVVCSIFATFVFNAGRRYTHYQGVEIGLLNLKDDRVIFGNPSMYIHSDPFGQKEISYGVELVKIKF